MQRLMLSLVLCLGSSAAYAQTAANFPGPKPDGSVQLPNQWRLMPTGKHTTLGDLPVTLALHPKGPYVVALHCGYGTHEVVVAKIEGDTTQIVSRVAMPQAFHGLSFDAAGENLFVSGGEFEVVRSYPFTNGQLGKPTELKVVDKAKTFVPAGIAMLPDGKRLATAGMLGNAMAVVDLAGGNSARVLDLGEGSYPFGVLALNNGKVLVSLWGKTSVALVDVDAMKVEATWDMGHAHPAEMALTKDGSTLFVACANSTMVAVVDMATGKVLKSLNCALYPKAPNGNTPGSLALSSDGKLLAVANADANNLALFGLEQPRDPKALGFIPTGWYPTSVRFHPDGRLLVTNGKGVSSRANPQGPNPLVKNQPVRQYIGGLFQGTLEVIEAPTPERLAEWTPKAYACSPLRADFGSIQSQPKGNPIPARVGDTSPIRHCIYIIKENRTYDQVFGDMVPGNGEKSLCLFPEKITPNHHALAREYVQLDNCYVDGEVSADGHEWSMGAYATDFVEKVWPLGYRGSPLKKFGFYPAEGTKDPVARPAGGYLWDRAAEAGISYRSYGEWVEGGGAGKPAKARVKALEGHFDPFFPSYNLDVTDQKRADRFLEELAGFEKTGDFPRLTILRLPNDHTSGTRPGKPTPTAMVADNDLALGRVVEGLSKSKFWKETAIFVIEDDAQNGPDHVDAHRSVALCISPFTRGRGLDSTLYSTSSMLRTMELVLGLKPMSQFDAAARPMYNAFLPKADTTPYKARAAGTDLGELNTAKAWGAKQSLAFDLSKEDAADDLAFNEVIWRSVKGAESPMPAPVRAAFFLAR